MTRLIGKLSKLSKYSASWSIVCTRLQTQAHVVIFLTLGELNKQQSQPTSDLQLVHFYISASVFVTVSSAWRVGVP